MAATEAAEVKCNNFEAIEYVVHRLTTASYCILSLNRATFFPTSTAFISSSLCSDHARFAVYSGYAVFVGVC